MTDDTEPTVTTDEQHEDTPPASVHEGLRDATTPLATTDPTTDAADLAPVGERLADADVVGLGEATHGTREFFELKHRLLRHLVVEYGVRAFAMEANLPEAMAIRDYIVHGDGDPREALAGVYFWTWQVESVLAMVEWLRAFNTARPRDDRVEFYGFDAQYTHGAVERLRDHLDAVDPDILTDVDDDLDVVDDEGEPPHQADDIPERVEAADRVVPRLRDHFNECRAAHVDATSERAWERARRYITVIEQSVSYAEAMDESDGDLFEDDDAITERFIRERDRSMADNVAWIRDHAGAESLVLWAHDAHLNRVEHTLLDSDVSAPSLGRHLVERHGDDYYALGFSFGNGAFQAISEDDDGQSELCEQHLDGPLPGTLDATLDGLDEPLAFIDLRAVREDERTADWLAEPRPQFRTGATFDTDAPENHLIEYVYADAFDGICFFAETTRARPIEDGGDADGEDTADAA